MKSSDVPASQGSNRPRVLPARRLILLATTIASLGAAALVVGPGLNLSSGYPAAVAQNLSEQARKLHQTQRSWEATARLTTELLRGGAVPAEYARQTLDAARQELEKTRQKAKQLSQ